MTKVVVCFLTLFLTQVFAQPRGNISGPLNKPQPQVSPERQQAILQGSNQGGPDDVKGKVNSDLANKPKGSMGFNEGLSRRDPFKLPEYLVIKIRQKQIVATVSKNESVIDDSVEPIRRWPLVNYQLVGIIWDVKKPKAMFVDRANNMHVVQINDFIGNAKGVITNIQSGSVTVLEGKIPQVLKLKK